MSRTRYRRRTPEGLRLDAGTVFSPALPFQMSLAVWGAVYTGDTANRVACMAEDDKDGNQAFDAMWDRNARSLAYEAVCVPGEGYKPVPEWWALPWLTQHILRGHEPYSPVPSSTTDTG